MTGRNITGRGVWGKLNKEHSHVQANVNVLKWIISERIYLCLAKFRRNSFKWGCLSRWRCLPKTCLFKRSLLDRKYSSQVASAKNVNLIANQICRFLTAASCHVLTGPLREWQRVDPVSGHLWKGANCFVSAALANRTHTFYGVLILDVSGSLSEYCSEPPSCPWWFPQIIKSALIFKLRISSWNQSVPHGFERSATDFLDDRLILNTPCVPIRVPSSRQTLSRQMMPISVIRSEPDYAFRLR